MLKNECYKIYGNVIAVIFIIFLFVFNGLQLIYLENKERSGYSDYTIEAYQKLWQDLKIYAEQNGNEWKMVPDKIEEMSAELATEKITYYTDNYYAELSLYERVQKEIAFTVNYNDYIDNMYESAQRLSVLPMYSDKDSFAYRKLVVMPKIYEAMNNVEPICEQSLGIRMAVKVEITDIIATAIIFYICVTLWQKEKEQGLMPLLRTSYRGRDCLVGCKLMVLVGSIIIMTLILYGTNIIIAAGTYGLGDLERPLASVYEFGTTHWNISVGRFLGCFLFFKILALMFLAFLISMFFCMLRNVLISQFFVLFTMVISYFLYLKIDALSILAPVKYLGLSGLMKTENIFLGGISINLLSNPVQFRFCFFAIIILGLLMCLIGIFVFATRYEEGMQSRINIKDFRCIGRYNCRHTSIFLHEMYKVLVKQKVLVLLLVFIVIQLYRSKPVEVIYYNVEEYYERFYLEQLQGPVTEEKILFIESEAEYLKTYQDEDRKERREAFDKIKERYVYIQKNEGAYFIYEGGLKELTGYYISNDIIPAILVMAVLSLMMPNFMAPDYQNGIYKLLFVTKHGKRKCIWIKYIFSIALTMIIFILIYVADFVRNNLSYKIPLEYYGYPVNSIMHLENWGSNISIGGYLCICTVLRILGVMCITFMIHVLSERIRSLVFTDMAALAIFALPLVVTYVKQSLLTVAYPYSWLLGNMALQNGIVFAVGAGMIMICFIINYIHVKYNKN